MNTFALVSVYNKNNLGDLCKTLKKYKIGIISTGSTYQKIKSLGFNCLEISKLTNFKEVLDGRVKTLHPKIYISILHKRSNNEHQKIFKKTNFPKIDYVVVNIYPFAKFAKLNNHKTIEMIDIGGPTLLRAAAKNFINITTISDPNDYKYLKNNIEKNSGITDLNFRKRMAKKTFELTSKYDQNIYNWFSKESSNKIKLRYGENPDQKAILHRDKRNSIVDYQINGKKISYNNILDIDSGLDFLNEFKEPTAVIIKHNNACGVGSSEDISNSFMKAYNCDKKSSFGGVVLINRRVGEKLAKLIKKKFFEVLVAPSFTKGSIKILKEKKNLILINSKKLPHAKRETSKTVRWGVLSQKNNNNSVSKNNFKIVSRNNKISKKEFEDIIFAFKIVKHIKSNAIVLVKNKQTLGIGAGQMNRFDATRIALMKYKDNFLLKNLVCASDAFFPFSDSLKLLNRNSCSCVVVPSGSVNDQKIIDYANKNNMKLIFSSKRVFKH